MSFVQYILFILQKTGRSLQAALNTFRQSMGEEVGSYSKQAFSKGRLRIRPEAIRKLYTFTVQEFYASADFQTFDGYRLLAIDGTKLNLPNTEELKQVFGVQQTSGAPQVQALVSGLYDVQNEVMVDVRISACTANERNHASELIDGLTESSFQKNLIIMDRGYPSAKLLHQIQAQGYAYVVRCSGEFIKGMNLTGNDCIIEHRFSQMKNLPLKIRIVRIHITEETEEILATNLLSEEFTPGKLAQIYKLRWGIETSYNNIKNRLYVENFSGTSETVVLQDFYATMLLWNMTGMMMFSLKDDIEQAHQSAENSREYHLNVSMTISTLKERVVEMLTCESPRKSKRILTQISQALYRSVVPSVLGRSSPRKRKHLALKFHGNSKFI